LERHIFLDKIEQVYGSLKNHRDTVNQFYNDHALEAFKQQRKVIQETEQVAKGKKTQVVIVPIEEGTPEIRQDLDEDRNSPDGDMTKKNKAGAAKKHFEMIKLKSEIMKQEKEDAYRRKVERNEKNYKKIKEMDQ
jgi:recombination DNA repair RAD52 pathway protein